MRLISYLIVKIVALGFVLLLTSCGREELQLVEISGPIMGTTYHIKFLSTNDKVKLEQVEAEMLSAMKSVDSLMSTYKSTSEISQFNIAPAGVWLDLSPDTYRVIAKAIEISSLSDGAFDITVGPLVRAWGFGPDARPIRVPTEEQLSVLRKKVGYTQLSLNKEGSKLFKQSDMEIDLSAIAKGYAVDKVAEALQRLKIQNFLVEIGGEIRASGEKANNKEWILAIESPVDQLQQVWKKISIGNNALATSGDYRNYFEENGVRYSHTINPTTGYPVQHKLTSVTVLRPTSAEADAMATMFMVLGEERGYELAVKNKIPAYFIFRNDKEFSAKFTKEFAPYLVE